MDSTPRMVSATRHSSRGGDYDDILAISIPFSGSVNTF